MKRKAITAEANQGFDNGNNRRHSCGPILTTFHTASCITTRPLPKWGEGICVWVQKSSSLKATAIACPFKDKTPRPFYLPTMGCQTLQKTVRDTQSAAWPLQRDLSVLLVSRPGGIKDPFAPRLPSYSGGLAGCCRGSHGSSKGDKRARRRRRGTCSRCESIRGLA